MIKEKWQKLDKKIIGIIACTATVTFLATIMIFGTRDDVTTKENSSSTNTTVSGNQDNKSEQVKEPSKPTKTERYKTYGMGETATLPGAEYTLKSAVLTPERNEFEENVPPLVLKIEFTTKNTGEGKLLAGSGVEVYGSDNKKSDSYPNDNTYDDILPDKEIDCVMHFTLNQPGLTEIIFEQNGSIAKFKVTV